MESYGTENSFLKKIKNDNWLFSRPVLSRIFQVTEIIKKKEQLSREKEPLN